MATKLLCAMASNWAKHSIKRNFPRVFPRYRLLFKLEETKLVVEIGDAYVNYRTKVGGIIPLPWRHLSVSEADAIARTAQP